MNAVTDARLFEMPLFSAFNDSVAILLPDRHVLLKLLHSVLNSGCSGAVKCLVCFEIVCAC